MVGRDATSGTRDGFESILGIKEKCAYEAELPETGDVKAKISSDEAAIDIILLAIEAAGYRPGDQVKLALDAAASEWRHGNSYTLPKSGRTFTAHELTEYWQKLIAQYSIRSIEDPLAEEDWTSWQALTKTLGAACQLVGDDLFVTNAKRLEKGISMGCANAILLKPNQIGTLSETMQTFSLAHRHGYGTILSHRSGETEDTTIADLAVALGAGQIKTGAPCRSERVCKYNRLLRIEDALGTSAALGSLPL